MSITNFPNGVSSWGMPSLAGALPPFTGNYYWVDETNGSDGYSGTSPDQPLRTLAQAQTLATANQNDVVFFKGTIHQTSTLTWAKNWVHLIGVAAPGNNPRARISSSGSTVFTPMVSVTAQGCFFANFSTFYGYDNASAQVCWADSGGRNYYSGVQFLGMGNATAAAQTGARHLVLSGSTGENIFDGCTIGLDTITRSAANASLEVSGASPRNEFHDCVFRCMTSAATSLYVTIGSGGIDRYLLMRRCTFLNAIDSTGTALTVGLSVNASAGGSVLLQDCASVGATKYSASGPVYVTGPVPTGATTGLAVAAS